MPLQSTGSTISPGVVSRSETADVPGTDSTSPESASLYRTLWRWHFYAGMLVAPVMFLASLTGALYVFHNEISQWVYRDLYFVPPAESRLSYDRQLELLQQYAPQMDELEGINLQKDPTRSTQFIAHALPGGDEVPGQKHRVYFMNPYDGKILGTYIMEEEFFHFVLDLHRTLCAGTTGRVLIELATCWGIVLTLTGLYLWWPANGWSAPGVLYPRLKAKFYLVLRDLHSVSGVYFSGLIVLVLWTGLFISVVWGTGFTLVSAKMGQSLFDFFAHAKSAPADEQTRAQLEPAVVTAFAQANPGDNVYFQLAHDPGQAHKVYLMWLGDTNTVRGLDIDQYNGKLVSSTSTEQLTPMVRLLALAVSLHQGKTFGLLSKTIAFLVCLVLMALSVTGVWMWWQRRPRGQLGLPRKPVGRLPRIIYVLAVLLGVVFPVVGISALLFWLIDTVFVAITRRRSVSAA